jgi:peptidylprolyl isomerase
VKLPLAASLALAAAGCASRAAAPPPAATQAPARPAAQAPAPYRSMGELLAASAPSDWRPLALEDALVLELPAGRVVLELAPAFAPRHAANVKALVRGGYLDGLAILRSQDNFVVQWGDPDADDAAKARPVPAGAEQVLPAEFTRPAEGLPFHRLPDPDGFAPEVGFAGGFHAARDPGTGRAWLAHCYGAVGAGRGEAPDSSTGAELYVVIGHAPRQLDRNVTVVGRVVQGMELLSVVPRGPAPMGFFESPAARVPIRRARVAADLPEAERPRLEVLRTDTPLFDAVLEARRNRRDAWYRVPAGHLDLCLAPIPVREAR